MLLKKLLNNKKFEITRLIPINAVTRTTISYRFFKGFIKAISQLRSSLNNLI